jgi:hypothetical protein
MRRGSPWFPISRLGDSAVNKEAGYCLIDGSARVQSVETQENAQPKA